MVHQSQSSNSLKDDMSLCAKVIEAAAYDVRLSYKAYAAHIGEFALLFASVDISSRIISSKISVVEGTCTVGVACAVSVDVA